MGSRVGGFCHRKQGGLRLFWETGLTEALTGRRVCRGVYVIGLAGLTEARGGVDPGLARFGSVEIGASAPPLPIQRLQGPHAPR